MLIGSKLKAERSKRSADYADYRRLNPIIGSRLKAESSRQKSNPQMDELVSS